MKDIKEIDKYGVVNINHTKKTIEFLPNRESIVGGVTMSILFFSQYIQEHGLEGYKVI